MSAILNPHLARGSYRPGYKPDYPAMLRGLQDCERRLIAASRARRDQCDEGGRFYFGTTARPPGWWDKFGRCAP